MNLNRPYICRSAPDQNQALLYSFWGTAALKGGSSYEAPAPDPCPAVFHRQRGLQRSNDLCPRPFHVLRAAAGTAPAADGRYAVSHPHLFPEYLPKFGYLFPVAAEEYIVAQAPGAPAPGAALSLPSYYNLATICRIPLPFLFISCILSVEAPIPSPTGKEVPHANR